MNGLHRQTLTPSFNGQVGQQVDLHNLKKKSNKSLTSIDQSNLYLDAALLMFSLLFGNRIGTAVVEESLILV